MMATNNDKHVEEATMAKNDNEYAGEDKPV